MRKVTPEALLRTGQAIPSWQIENLLRAEGFEIKNGGRGSHSTYSHELLPGQRFGLVFHSKKLDPQYIAAQAVLEVQALKEALKEATPPSLDVTEDFDVASTSKIELPDDLELVLGRRNPGTYIRCRKYPQIATQISLDINSEDLAIKVDYVQRRAEMLGTLIDRCVNEMDFEITQHPNGAIELTHKVYPLDNLDGDKMLKPFCPRLRNFTSISRVEKIIRDVEKHDKGLKKGLKEILAFGDITELDDTADPDTGMTTQRFQHTHPLSLKVNEFTLLATPSGRISHPAFLQTLDTIDKFRLLGKQRELQQILKSRFGIHLHRTRDGHLEGKHAVYKGLNFQVPDFTILPSYAQIANEADDAGLEEVTKGLRARILDISQKRTEAYATIIKKTQLVDQRQMEEQPHLQALALKLKRFSSEIVYPIRNLEFGKEITGYVLSEKKIASHPFPLTLVSSQNGKLKTLLIDESEIKKLDAYADEVIKEITRRNPTSCAQPSPPRALRFG